MANNSPAAMVAAGAFAFNVTTTDASCAGVAGLVSLNPKKTATSIATPVPSVFKWSELRPFAFAFPNSIAAEEGKTAGRLAVGRFGSTEGFEPGFKSRFMMVFWKVDWSTTLYWT